MTWKLVRILLVEDNPDTQFVIKIVLDEMENLLVEAVQTGEEAIKKAVTFLPDLIILDYMLPGIDGMETLRELRKIPQSATTPAILMSAQPPEMSKLMDLGVVHVIAKPFDPLALSSLIEAVWQQHAPPQE